MIRKQSAEEQIATMQRLINFGINEDSAKSSKPIVEFKRKAANGKTYGIIRESTKYYIKEAPQKDTEVLAEDFNYIGGFNNRKENEYTSYAKASNALDLKLMSINESVNKAQKIVIETPVIKADWEDKLTESMRKEIDRFKEINKNVSSILKEDKAVGKVPSEHTLPEAPATNPSEEKVNSPFTDTAVAEGEKDFKKEETDHEKAGAPFDKDGEVSNKEMESDKKPVVKTDATYTEKAKYVPENSVADKNPSGGKVVRVNENNGHKIRLKLTEEQVLAWNDNKNYMDKTHGTEIGSSAPFTDKLGKESNQTEAPTEPIHEGESVVYDHPNEQNSPESCTSKAGDSAPFIKKVNEEIVSAEDAAGMPDESEDFSDYPFPEVAENEYQDYGTKFDKEYNDFENSQADDTEYEIDLDDEYGAENVDKALLTKYGKDGMKGLENWQDDWDKFDDDDDDFAYESKRTKGKKVNEDKLNDFGKHPAYRKTPMTTPPNKEVAINGAKEWDDESAQGEEPFGQQIGDSAPYDEIVDVMTESILASIYGNKKKV